MNGERLRRAGYAFRQAETGKGSAGDRAVVYGNKKSLRKSGGFFVAENAKAFATN